ncbi:DNA polymerase-3 subunit beta [Streptomonospora nanhaiensis]|uniref:DNA polymerase-3 subunit beta n=1 Tax=Streptomonospora nanhaiensis TaxID=1323731 RepID=A0A853BMH3_9ACTN|nr:DNA polymerase-3 subunit beta [Streptomonospora nanhaiensis]
MKLTVDSRALAAELAWAVKFLPARPAVPVLAGVRLDATDGLLRVTVFDYDTCARAEVPADIEEEGAVLAPGRVLAAAAGHLPDGPALLEAEGPALGLSCGSARFRLLTLPLEDYPHTPAVPEPLGEIDGDALAEAVAGTHVACSTDLTLPMFTGVLLTAEGTRVRLQATDRYRLAEQALDWTPTRPGAAARVLVPGRVLATAARAMTGAPVRIGLAEDHGTPSAVTLAGAGRSLTATLLDTKDYPDLNRFFTTAAEGEAVIAPTQRLLEAVRRAATIAYRHTPVALTITADRIDVECGVDDTQSGDTVSAVAQSETRVAFNPAYLADALSHIPGGTVRLLVPPGGSGLVLLTADEDDPAYRHIVVPVRTADAGRQTERSAA